MGKNRDPHHKFSSCTPPDYERALPLPDQKLRPKGRQIIWDKDLFVLFSLPNLREEFICAPPNIFPATSPPSHGAWSGEYKQWFGGARPRNAPWGAGPDQMSPAYSSWLFSLTNCIQIPSKIFCAGMVKQTQSASLQNLLFVQGGGSVLRVPPNKQVEEIPKTESSRDS